VGPERQDNLWKPVPVDFGAHGDFDWQAKSFNWLLWADLHRKVVAAWLLAIAVLGLAASRSTFKTKAKI
jgi:hypothetical protein